MNCRCIDFPDYKLETEAATWSVIERRDVLKNSKNFSGKHLCQSLFCEFSEIFKNTFFTEYLLRLLPKAVSRRYSVKKVFIEISQISQENTQGRSQDLKRPLQSITSILSMTWSWRWKYYATTWKTLNIVIS